MAHADQRREQLDRTPRPRAPIRVAAALEHTATRLDRAASKLVRDARTRARASARRGGAVVNGTASWAFA